MPIKFKTQANKKYQLVYFELDDVLQATDLKTLKPPDAVTEQFAHLGVVLSGRGPIWLYGFLVHFYHPTKWVAIHDPRLKGAVVIASHSSDVKVGDLIPLENATDGTH